MTLVYGVNHLGCAVPTEVGMCAGATLFHRSKSHRHIRAFRLTKYHEVVDLAKP